MTPVDFKRLFKKLEGIDKNSENQKQKKGKNVIEVEGIEKEIS